MVGRKLRGHAPGMGQLAVRLFLETDGERLHRQGGGPGHEGHDGAGVDAAGEERPQGDVGDHAQADRLLEQSQELVAGAGEIPGPFARPNVPVLAQGCPAVLVDQDVAGGELAHRAKDGIGGGNVLQGQKEIECLRVHVAGDAGVLQDGFDLGGEHQPAAFIQGVIEGLLADGIPGQDQAAVPAVKDGESEHAAQPADELQAEFLVEVDHDLGVALRAEGAAAALQFSAQLGKIVHFAVVGDPRIARAGGQRLVAGVQVDDAQASGGEPRAVGKVVALVIGTAVNDAVVHPLQGPGIGLILQLEKSAYPAHG